MSSEKEFHFPITIRKNDTQGNVDRITVHLDENAVHFDFPGDGTGSAPISKWTANHTWQIETTDKPYPSSGRQSAFEMLIRTLSALHPNRMVPVRIVTNDGSFRLDKTCAEWALVGGNFCRVADDKGRHYLKPS